MSVPPACPAVPISWGELLDKISILELKLARIADPAALEHVEHEHALLAPLATPIVSLPEIARYFEQLRAVNDALWWIEDAIRTEDQHQQFGAEFIRLARQVYQRNDERSSIKRKINVFLGSQLIEEKSFASARTTAVAL